MTKFCEDQYCNRKAKFEHQGRSFCSDICAQSGSYKAQENTGSEVTAGFISPALGGQSQAFSKEEKMKESASAEIPRKEEITRGATIEKTWSTQESIPESNRELAITEISNLPAKKNGNESLTEILPQESVDQLQNLGGVKFQSMNLIDDSILHLHGLMKSVGSEIRDRAANGDRVYILDPKLIATTCSVAKQVGAMLKLKLDFHKVMKEK